MENELKRKALRIQQFSAEEEIQPTDIYLTSMTAGEVADKSGIHRWSRRDKSGYQRPPDQKRLNPNRRGTTANYLIDELGAFPTSVLINVTGAQISFSKEDEMDGWCEVGELEIPAKATLTTIDGQHRCEALMKANNKSEKNFSDYPLPVTLLNVDKNDEVLYFFMVNDRQKGVSTKLTARILQQQLLKEKNVPQWFIDSSTPMQRRKGKAASIVDELDEMEGSPFKGHVAVVDEERSDQRFLRDYTLISSIEPILREKTFDAMDYEKVAEHLSTYWETLRDMWPEPFENPGGYSIFGTGSMIALNSLFPSIYHRALEEKGEVSKEAFDDLLSPLKKRTHRHEHDQFKGPITSEFWSKDRGPSIARASSKADADDLYNQLKQKIDLGS